jgi:hypothetical protein
MGYWGVKSYENDEADEALDRGFEAVHGAIYDELMDDRNPMTLEQVQAKLANPSTLARALAYHEQEVALPIEDWDEVDRLGFVGIVVRHAELNVPVPDDWRKRAVDWLREESIDWDEATLRKLRVQKEIELLQSTNSGASQG